MCGTHWCTTFGTILPCDMFTGCTHSSVKEAILKNFCDSAGALRIVVATIAFGMGLDCPNVRRIIHWGASSDIEAYMQETGRARRDGLSATAVLYTVKYPSNRFLDASIKEYIVDAKYFSGILMCLKNLILHVHVVMCVKLNVLIHYALKHLSQLWTHVYTYIVLRFATM